jgi:Kef-type K+ transport system membrane component KefB
VEVSSVSLSAAAVAGLVAAIAIIVVMAHTVGYLFARLHQPPAIGEILAGLLFGPSLFGLLAPDAQRAIFPTTGPVAAGLAGLAQLGLLLLMFVTGREIEVDAPKGERRTIGLVAGAGMIVPFAVALAIAPLIDYHRLAGPFGSRTAIALVFSIAVAVTSIPVISRILLDLGILREPFSRLILSVAGIEDIVLYGVLALVLSLAHSSTSDTFGLWSLVGVTSTAWTVIYHVTVTVLFVVAFLAFGRPVLHWLLYGPTAALARRNPTTFRVALPLLAFLLCTVLDINPIFGALLCGYSARRADPSAEAAAAWDAIRHFSLAFFVPIYFFTVGLNLNLVHNFDPVFFVWFFALCCVVKAASVYSGAKLAGQPSSRAFDLAVALNARGGPGIVLATVTLAAGIVNASFFTSMVLLSVLTSQIAGFWLERRLPRLVETPQPVVVSHV